MKITKEEFFNTSNKIKINQYKSDYNNNRNYFIYNGYLYEFYSYTQRLGYEFGIKEEFYKNKTTIKQGM
tara:strand:+ start:137 stop:343 length:207 start_codon:yes stop_codon:yes gene_type:complete